MKIKRIIAAATATLLVATQAAFAAEFKDMPDDWSTEALQNAVDNGLLGGSDGYIFPNDNMTRAEMATIMARACGATAEADISQFTDVKVEDWYYSSMAKAVAMKAFNGSGNKLNPDDFITRQEAFVVLARVFSLNLDKKIDETVIDDFKDGDKVAAWARKEVAAVIGGGFVSGSNGYVNPENNISRAEFAVVMNRLVSHYIDDETAEIPETGNIMIRVGGIELDGLKGDRMVIIGDGAGQTDMNIKNADLKGRFVVRGGKEVTLTGAYDDIRIVMPFIRVSCGGATANGIYVGKDSVVDLGTLTGPDTSGTDAEETETPATEETEGEAAAEESTEAETVEEEVVEVLDEGAEITEESEK